MMQSFVKNCLLLHLTESDTNKAAGAMREIMNEYCDQLSKELKAESEKIAFAIKESKAEMMVAFFNSPSYRYWLGYEPVNPLSQIAQPVLAINGELDFVTVSKIQLPIIEQALKKAGNNGVTVTDMPGMNHWLQQCSTGAMAEYGSINQRVDSASSDAINGRLDQCSIG